MSIYHNSSTASKYREITVYYTHTILSLNNNSNKQLAQKNLAKNTIHHQGQKYVTNSIENPSREKKNSTSAEPIPSGPRSRPVAHPCKAIRPRNLHHHLKIFRPRLPKLPLLNFFWAPLVAGSCANDRPWVVNQWVGVAWAA